jgi:hypothetical protein
MWYQSPEAAMSESLPASEAGPANMVRIFVGGRGACGATSETIDAAREVTADAPGWLFATLGLATAFTGAAGSIDPDGSSGVWAVVELNAARLSVSKLAFRIAAAAAALTAAVASSDSLSPTHERVNHRPPAMPRISRFAVRQRRGLFLLLSSGIRGARPVGILGGGWTGNGFDGRG